MKIDNYDKCSNQTSIYSLNSKWQRSSFDWKLKNFLVKLISCLRVFNSELLLWDGSPSFEGTPKNGTFADNSLFYI